MPRNTAGDRQAGFGVKDLVNRLKELKSSDLDETLVIGIDFGTTYSGAAWATVDDFENDEINLITNWPGNGREEGKAPTELFYEHGKVMWGYDIPPDADAVRWFKLLLLREEDLAPELRQSEYVLRGRKMLRELNKSATDYIADYLRVLWQHIMTTICKARSTSIIAALTFHVVITVPAIWKNYARQAMEEAAGKAGILERRSVGPTTLTFAPEPEAAALASLCERGRHIKTNDVYMICDAGGGTVDLISYRVGGKDPIELHEAVVGTGGLCGGIFIDEAFEAICKARLGRQWNSLSQSGIKEIMKGEWEYAIKPQYRPRDDDREYIVAIPAEAFKGQSLNDESRRPLIKNGRIHFSSSDIQKAFTRVFSDIEELIDGQIRKAKEKSLSVKGIILVGGLGSSPYLYEHLNAKYAKKRIEVLQSTGIKPRTAICRGAIFKGFLDRPSAAPYGISSRGTMRSVKIASMIARQSLGVKWRPTWKKGIHREEDKYWDTLEGVWRAKNQMMWYMKKGENVSKAEPVRCWFKRLYESKQEWEDDDNNTKVILQSDDDSPPSRYNSSIEEFCTIRFSLEDITYDSLTDFGGADGQMLKKFKYYVQMTPSGDSTEFAIYFNGRKLGSKTALIDFQ